MSSPDPLNAATYYVADGYDTDNRTLMGRRAAGEAYLRAFVRHGGVSPLYCLTPSEAAFQAFRTQVAGFADNPPAAEHLSLGDHRAIARAGTVFYPGPDIARLAWPREPDHAAAYSLCGVTHTTASHGVMDAIGALVHAPLYDWDALICTSRAVRQTIECVLGTMSEQQQARYGTPLACRVQLPIIPLGVECAIYAQGREAQRLRAGFRQRLGIGDGDIAVLSLSRLSYHGKAHPLPMFVALEAAAKSQPRPVHLILAGWFSNDALKRHFAAAAAALCPSVKVHMVDGRDRTVRTGIWFAAEIFSLMSDNIQETFGLAPLEAMAAGLPVVATDWNGFRETVRDGEDGIMVPTWMPGPGYGADLAMRHDLGVESYDRYIGAASQATAVDISATREAFASLIANPGLRTSMGEAGQARARQEFDWPVIIRRYQELWAELAARRAVGDRTATSVDLPPAPPGGHNNPVRDDPFRAFAGYPTHLIGPRTMFQAADGEQARATAKLVRRLDMNVFSRAVLPSDATLDAVVERLIANGATAAQDLVEAIGPDHEPTFYRGLGWLAKMGIAEIVS